jgi:starch synthase
LRVLFASSEIYPLAKTGGLADVSAALPKALARLGVDVHLLLPAYPSAVAAAEEDSIAFEFADFMGAGPLRLISARTPDTRLPIWLVDCPTLFRRPGGPYQDQDRQDWPDNARRFAVLNHIAARLSRGDLLPDWKADIVHANDWPTGLVSAILVEASGQRPATVFTIHNLAYQGLFPAALYPQLGLPEGAFNPDGLEFHGQISFVKAGIRYSDRLTTVSPTYAQEILTPDYGCGLEGLLQRRAQDLTGILNGVDYEIWNPARDVHLPANFSLENIAGKRTCKTALQEEYGLRVDPEVPLIVFVSRITDQKMADVVAAALPHVIGDGALCVLLGDGERHLEEQFAAAALRHPGRIAFRVGYEEPLAHRLVAGGDVLLHPARYEPCGLTQLYAMRYGTLPVVRATGGLCDTVVDATDDTVSRGTATGFVFQGTTRDDMVRCVERALALYHQPLAWRLMQRQAMAQDFSWEKSAHRYLALYRSLLPNADSTRDPDPRDSGGQLISRLAHRLQAHQPFSASE